jgi:hypothetical protein
VLFKSDFANSLGPVVKEHCDQLELQLRRLRQLVSQKDAPKENILPQVPRMLTRLESTPLLPSQQRKNELEQLNFSPIDEPKSIIQRSIRERQSLRISSVKAKIVTNGTLNYCTPRLQRKLTDNGSSSSKNYNDTVESVPRFTTEFSLRDLSRNLQQPTVPSSLARSSSSTVDSQLNAELEEILAQLDQLFPSQPFGGVPCSATSSCAAVYSSENATLVRATNQVAGVLAEFVDGFNE